MIDDTTNKFLIRNLSYKCKSARQQIQDNDDDQRIFKIIGFRNGNRCKYVGSHHKSSSLRVTQHMPMFRPGWRLVSSQRRCLTFSLQINCLYLDAIVKLQFQYYSLFAAPQRPIRHFLRLWPESAKSSGDLIRPFFPSQPGAYRWDLINSAISRLSCSQDC